MARPLSTDGQGGVGKVGEVPDGKAREGENLSLLPPSGVVRLASWRPVFKPASAVILFFSSKKYKIKVGSPPKLAPGNKVNNKQRHLQS